MLNEVKYVQRVGCQCYGCVNLSHEGVHSREVVCSVNNRERKEDETEGVSDDEEGNNNREREEDETEGVSDDEEGNNNREREEDETEGVSDDMEGNNAVENRVQLKMLEILKWMK